MTLSIANKLRAAIAGVAVLSVGLSLLLTVKVVRTTVENTAKDELLSLANVTEGRVQSSLIFSDAQGTQNAIKELSLNPKVIFIQISRNDKGTLAIFKRKNRQLTPAIHFDSLKPDTPICIDSKNCKLRKLLQLDGHPFGELLLEVELLELKA